MESEITTLEQLKTNGYVCHHRALIKRYVSRQIAYKIEPYKGRFGEGYAVTYPNRKSTTYSFIEYYVKPSHQ